jgi:hypothetical protein
VQHVSPILLPNSLRCMGFLSLDFHPSKKMVGRFLLWVLDPGNGNLTELSLDALRTRVP